MSKRRAVAAILFASWGAIAATIAVVLWFMHEPVGPFLFAALRTLVILGVMVMAIVALGRRYIRADKPAVRCALGVLLGAVISLPFGFVMELVLAGPSSLLFTLQWIVTAPEIVTGLIIVPTMILGSLAGGLIEIGTGVAQIGLKRRAPARFATRLISLLFVAILLTLVAFVFLSLPLTGESLVQSMVFAASAIWIVALVAAAFLAVGAGIMALLERTGYLADLFHRLLVASLIGAYLAYTTAIVLVSIAAVSGSMAHGIGGFFAEMMLVGLPLLGAFAMTSTEVAGAVITRTRDRLRGAPLAGRRRFARSAILVGLALILLPFLSGASFYLYSVLANLRNPVAYTPEVDGRAIDEATGKPLSGALVRLTWIGTVPTEAQKNLPPGFDSDRKDRVYAVDVRLTDSRGRFHVSQRKRRLKRVSVVQRESPGEITIVLVAQGKRPSFAGSDAGTSPTRIERPVLRLRSIPTDEAGIEQINVLRNGLAEEKRITSPQDVENQREFALRACERFLTDFPDSEHVPDVLFTMGKIYESQIVLEVRSRAPFAFGDPRTETVFSEENATLAIRQYQRLIAEYPKTKQAFDAETRIRYIRQDALSEGVQLAP